MSKPDYVPVTPGLLLNRGSIQLARLRNESVVVRRGTLWLYISEQPTGTLYTLTRLGEKKLCEAFISLDKP